jgi:hypothetical protein
MKSGERTRDHTVFPNISSKSEDIDATSWPRIAPNMRKSVKAIALPAAVTTESASGLKF